MSQLNYHHLYYFYVTAREGSIIKASKVLYLTPQTISGQIGVLEDSMGYPLFDRIGKRLMLNAQGRIAFSYAEDIFRLGTELVHTIKNASEGQQQIFSIGVTDVLPKVLAFDLFRSCFDENQKIRLVCKEGDLDFLLGELAANRIDIILSDQPLTPGTRVAAYNHLIGESSITFFATANVATRLSEGFPHSLHHQAMLIPGDKAAQKLELMAWFNRIGVIPQIKAEFEDSALMKLFGQAGYGIFCGPTTIEKHISEQYQVEIIGRTNELKERLYLISPERKLKHPAVVPLFEHAKTLVSSH